MKKATAETANGKEDVKKTVKTPTARTRKARTAKEPADGKEAVKAAAKKAEETVAAVKEAAKKAETTVKESAKKAETTVKESARKAEVVRDEIQESAKKAVARAAKKVGVKETVYLQYSGKEISAEALMERVKYIWTGELNNKETDISAITLYLKPEENRVYYVINGDVTGSLEL